MAGLKVSVRMSSHASNEIGRVKLDVGFSSVLAHSSAKMCEKAGTALEYEAPNQTGINYRSKLGSVIFMISLS